MLELPHHATLLIIDVQNGFDDPCWGARNNPDAEHNIRQLLEHWRRTGRPVIHVRHASRSPSSPLRPGQRGFDIKDEVCPASGEPVIEKSVNSAFIGTDLEAMLRSRGVTTLVLAGLTTPHCVSTTARMAGNLGFETYVVSDATAAVQANADFGWRGPDARPLVDPELIHLLSLATLHGEFATVVDTAALLQAAPLDRARVTGVRS